MGTKNFFLSKINWSAIVIILTSIQSQYTGLDLSKMTFQSWAGFVLGILIIIFRTYFTTTTIGGNPPTS